MVAGKILLSVGNAISHKKDCHKMCDHRKEISENLTIYIIRVTLNTEFDTIWLSRVCAKTTCLNLMRPFAPESPLTRDENDDPYILTVPCFNPE